MSNTRADLVIIIYNIEVFTHYRTLRRLTIVMQNDKFLMKSNTAALLKHFINYWTEYIMEQSRDIQKLVQIAKMYYIEGMTQESIAKIIGISRSTVSQLITEAKNAGLVQITIKDPAANNQELASEFEKRFGLRKCIVVPTTLKKHDMLLKIVVSQMVRVMLDVIKSHSSFGMAWGTACYEFMQAFPDDTDFCDITVVPLIGGSSLAMQEFQINECVRQFAEKVNGNPLFMYSPGIVESLDDKMHFLESVYMKGILEQWKQLDSAVIGIGRPVESFEGGPFALDNQLSRVRKNPEGHVGDFCARYFNIRGEFMNCSHNDRLIGIDGDCLRNVKNVAAIAVGETKVFPIIGALNSGILHYFATDEHTAKQVLDLLDSGALDDILK